MFEVWDVIHFMSYGWNQNFLGCFCLKHHCPQLWSRYQFNTKLFCASFIKIPIFSQNEKNFVKRCYLHPESHPLPVIKPRHASSGSLTGCRSPFRGPPDTSLLAVISWIVLPTEVRGFCSIRFRWCLFKKKSFRLFIDSNTPSLSLNAGFLS